MPRIPLERAFALEPVYQLTLGPKSYGIPPLTLGRFMALSGADWISVLRALLGSARLGDAPSPEAGTDLRSVARHLAALDHAAFYPALQAVAPHVPEKEWREHGNAVEVMCLVDHFANAHDWGFIGESTGFGKPREEAEPADRNTVAAALLAFSRSFSAHKPEDLLAMRVEGFFHLKNAAMELAGEQSDSGEDLSRAANVPVIHDPDKKSPIWAAIANAKRVN